MPKPQSGPPVDPAARARTRLRRASWIAGGMGVFALIAAAWVALSASPKLESPELPDPNGFDAALRAAKVIEQATPEALKSLDITKADAETIRPWVAANREAVATFREAIRQPFQVPVTYDLLKISDEVNQYAPLRTIGGRALMAEGWLAHLEGRNEEAARAFLDLIGLGNAMGRNVPMMPYMSSLAPIGLGLIGLREIREDLNDEELARVIPVLESFDAEAVPLSEPTRLEFAFVEKNVRTQLGLGGIVLRVSGALARDKAAIADTLAFSANGRVAARRLVLVELALQRYRLKHGGVPESLDALVPTILKTLPVDPFSGKPLIYRQTATGRELYSTGPDRDDDRLNPRLPGRHGPTANGDLTIDSI